MLPHVGRTERIDIKASTMNKIIDATNNFGRRNAFGNNATKHYTDFYIKNKTGKKLPIYSVVMITDIENDFSDSADEAENLNEFIGMKIVFRGGIPDKDSPYFDKICILQQPLDIDEVGVGIINGLSKCYTVVKESENFSYLIKSYLRAEHNNTDYLVRSNFGNLELFFSVDSSGVIKNIPQLSVVNVGSASLPSYFLVDMIWKSGGDSTTEYEPRIYDIVASNAVNAANNILKADVDPASGKNPYRRPLDFNVTKANRGLAYYSPEENETGILIVWCNEYPMLSSTPEVMP